jgi:hypothetical protein
MKNDILHQVEVRKGIKALLDWQVEQYESMQAEESDRLVAICGYEGSGKSYLALELFENWWRNVIKSNLSDAEIMQYFATDDIEWAEAFQKCVDTKYLMLTHDEAVNLIYSKDATSKQSKELNKAFKKTRGLSVYHLMLIPQPQRIDKELRQDRLRTIYYVFKLNKKRYVAVYPKTLLDTALAELDRMLTSQALDVKTRPSILDCQTKPSLIFEMDEYKGNLLSLYKPKKAKNMSDSVSQLVSIIKDKKDKETKKKDKEERNTTIKLAKALGLSASKIADIANISKRQVHYTLNKHA